MTISTPPPPLDDPSVSSPLECPPLKWGIIGCGRVSHDFVQALKHLPTASVVACAARSKDDAQEFATKHGIPNYYGSYDDLLKNEDVECVYVGNVHSFRRQIGEKCLKANKHTLLEKPFACSVEDAEYLISLAKERKLFLMEVSMQVQNDCDGIVTATQSCSSTVSLAGHVDSILSCSRTSSTTSLWF